MKRFWILMPALVVVAALTLTATPVSAQGGQTTFGQPVTIRSGQTVRGDLVSLGGPVTVERGAVVKGDVVSMGGPISIAGQIEGDVTSFGGPVTLASTAVVEGDVVSAGGPISKSEGAVVRGEIVQGFRFGDLRFLPFGPRGGPPGAPEIPVPVDSTSGVLSAVLNLLGIGFRAAGIAVIALLLLIFAPDHTNRVKKMTAAQPIASVGVGLLTLIVAVLLLGVLIITICGIPIALILGLGLLMALLYGWIALGVMVGERLLAALNTERPMPLISGVVGVLLLTLLSAIPCLGPLIGFVGGCWGLGAVVLSRGGTSSQASLPGGWVPAPAGAPPAGPATVAAPPAAPAAKAARTLDDLQVIWGIGPVYEGMLREAGIRTYADLASSSPEELIEAVSGPDVIPVAVGTAQRWIEEAQRRVEEA